jgi:hypothetical protein
VLPFGMAWAFIGVQLAIFGLYMGASFAPNHKGMPIDHHLFHSMPRPHLRAARRLVREHCRSNDIPNVEASLLPSYRTVIAYLNRVGLAPRDPFDCPLAGHLRPS